MTESILFSLLRGAVSAEHQVDCELAELSEDTLAAVYTLSKRHDMAHLIGHGLAGIGWSCDGEIMHAFRKATLRAVYRCARQQDEFERISRVLEAAKIPYVPLKGTIIRDWYPEPWMRTSTDIDILVRKDDLDAGVRALTEELGYRHEGTAFHDASLFSPMGVHLELHYELADTLVSDKMRTILLDVWDHTSAAEGAEYRMEMDADWFYLYHIFHMTKHICTGGCGIKPFLDLWIMNREKGYSAERFAPLLEQCGLLTAARAAEKLADIWFSGGDMDDLSRRLAAFVLDGGVHGTMDGYVKAAQAREGGKFRNIWQKIFAPYAIMKEIYPVLNKHKWLLPGAEVLRWVKLLFGGSFNRAANILWKNITVSGDVREQTGRLLRDLDLL